MNLSDCQLTIFGHTQGAATLAKGVLPYFLHCIASQVDTFVCHTERFEVLKKPAFFLCFSSMHTCLLCFDNYDVVT